MTKMAFHTLYQTDNPTYESTGEKFQIWTSIGMGKREEEKKITKDSFVFCATKATNMNIKFINTRIILQR